MPATNVSLLPVASLSQPVASVLASSGPEKQTVSSQLNATLKSELISAANTNGQATLASVLQSLSAADFAADQNLSLRDFVAKYTKLLADPTAQKAAQTAIATLSTTTTIGALLGLTSTVVGNPVLGGIVAQTNLATLLGTSPALTDAQLQSNFIQKYSAFQGSMQEFWTQLSQDAEFKAAVPELQFTMQLGVLTLNNTQLTGALRATYKPASVRALTTLDAASLTQLITTQKILIPSAISGSTPAEQLTNYVTGIIGLLQAAFPTDYVAKQLTSASNSTLQSVAKVLSNAPDIDLRSTNLSAYLAQNSAAAFKDIAAGQVAAVTAGLLSVQRAFRISQEPVTVATLVSTGMDSAAKIAALARSNFVSQFSAALGEAQAQAIYSAAGLISAQTLNLYTAVHDGLNGVSPAAIANPSSKLVETLQQQIPNWQQLFGSTSYCSCDECGSVYGPAAYFVDLLQFLQNSQKNAAGFSPLDVLIGGTTGSVTLPGRRPDLPYIKLDCQNANTPLPFIDLVTEILESYVVLGGKLDSTTAHNTPADATAAELSVNPEYTMNAAYSTLAQSSYPLAVPYDRFLDTARSYLTFLGGDRRELIELFGTQPAPADAAGILAAETLGLSQAEFKLIANWDVQTGSAVAALALNTLYLGNTQAITPWETWIASVPNFLDQTGLAFEELVELLETEFVNPGQTITLAGAAACDLTQTTITTLDDPTLTRILPFLRLWKKLNWSMSDLDKTLGVFAPNGINRSCLLALADLVHMQSQSGLTLPQLLSLWSGIDTDGRDSLYVTLFQNEAVLNPVDSALQISYRAALPAMPANPLPPSVPSTQMSYDGTNHQLVFTGRMTDDQRADLLSTWASGNTNAALAVENLYQMRWAPGTEIKSGGTITDSTPSILAALRISTIDLGAIRTAAGLLDTATKISLSLANVAQLYRYTVLAQALGFSIPDLIALIPLTGLNPFQLASTDAVTATTKSFFQAVQAVAASPFSVPQLSYIYRAIANPAAGVGPLDANIDVLAITLQTGLVKAATTNAYVPDPTGKLLRQKLGTVVSGASLSAAMDLIAGTAIYAAPLPALPPGVVFPISVSGLVSYDAVNQNLTYGGAMTDSQKAILSGLSTDAAYQNAVSALYQQPRTILSSYLAFLNPSQALANLIDSPLPNVADRFDYVLQDLLYFLTDTQSRALVQQSLSQALGLDSATVALLLSGDPGLSSAALLSSQRDASESAMADFLDLSDGGLLATYFSDSGLTTVAATRIDPMVSGSGVSSPGSARWIGKMQPQFSEAYTFTVTANDGVRLWINDQLVIDQWANQAVSTRTGGPINLNAGQLYDLRLDYYNASAAATLVFNWSSKSTSNNASIAIPTSALFPENTFLSLSRLYSIGLLLSTFGMKAPEVAYLSSHATDFAGVDPSNSANTVKFDLSALPMDRSNAAGVDHAAPAFFNQWSQLNDLFALRNSLPSGNVSLFDVFRAASGSSNPTQLSGGTISAVLAATTWDAGQFTTLSGNSTVNSTIAGFGLSDGDFVNAAGRQSTGLVRLKKCLDFSARVGVPALQLFLCANQAPDSAQANDIKSTVKAKYDDATWVTVGKGLNNKIRDNSKSALIAYILNMPTILQLGLSDADKLYEYFLIDVQMSSCMQTSRIVQASAAIQLFVQRCLLNLEDSNANAANNVSPGAIDVAQWEWRKNYRVWEANREVFLYPENWIDPTLRDNRTPFFQDLQGDLQQGEVTADLAETAFRNYLAKLLEVSRLEICGCFSENDSDPDAQLTHDVLHVFGRTYAQPHVYYYRALDRIANVWSPWEKIDADIQGDHLIPVMWNRRLYLFWPIFKEQTTPNSANGGNFSSNPSLPLKSLEIQFAWSEYQNGAWSKKQVAAYSLTPNGYDSYTYDFDPSALTFSAQVSGPALTIYVYWAYQWSAMGRVYHQNAVDLSNAGYVTFNGCSSIPTGGEMSGPATHTFPPRTYADYMDLESVPTSVNLGFALATLVATGTETNSQGLVEVIYTSSPVQVLNVAFPFSLLYAEPFWPNVQMNVAPPFFYMDSVQTYLVTQYSSGFASVLTAPVNAVVPYSAQQLSPPADGVLTSPALPIFAPAVVSATASPAGAASAGIVTTAAGTLSATATTTAAALPITTGATTTEAPPLSNAPTATPGNWDSLPIASRTQLTFVTHRHAHVCDFLKALNWEGVSGLLTLANQRLDDQDVGTASGFYQTYGPTTIVNLAYPSQQVDFSPSGAYSIYNWELFFHIPLLIATQLSQNQQFEDAEIWFRYIFNPTSNSPDPVPSRYWNVLPFYQNTNPQQIENLIKALASPGPEQTAYMQQIAAWVQTPFDPDLIARMRIVAYQKAVVMKYIDHQLAWGDSLYRQFTRESVNEATLHYILCQDILGDKPVMIPPQGVIADQTYASLRSSLDGFSDALVTLENLFPFSTTSSTNSDGSGSSTATGVAMIPYFCIPPNDTLLGYWDTVAQRLYQIRHCTNISGQVQQLPLFAPPINPGMLIQALQMGMDLTSALTDISAATPFYRFQYMLPKAMELCAEVRSLGTSLLSALEKSDGEALSNLRATQEMALMKAVRSVKQQQLKEANSNLDSLNDALAVTTNRQQYYQELIKQGLIDQENSQVSDINWAMRLQLLGQGLQVLAAATTSIPDATAGGAGISSPVAVLSTGGNKFAKGITYAAEASQALATISSTKATLSGIQAEWTRRGQEWAFQSSAAALEIQQINDQIVAANARLAAAQADLDNQDLLISNASALEQFLRRKFTNQDLYDWMTGQVSSVYFQCYQMAYDLAKRAEACFVFERMPDLSSYTPFVQYGYWDSLKKGLLSGERLYQDLKRLEIAYMDQDQRDYEITKSISLLLLDPMALINLKETGQCTVQFPEALFDMDYPGHFLRRIKMLSLTIPCVVGPYTSLNCTLTLATNKIRVNNIAADAKDYVKDSHFLTNFSAVESIATSTGQNDTGLFSVNFNDERYLPFEGAGVISTWQLSMPQDTNAFDFETITDVIFNVRYTARDGGASLRSIARAAAVLPPGSTPGASPVGQTALPQQQTATRMFSLRHEFPNAWNLFLHPPDSVPDQTMTINLTQDRFPFQDRGKKIQIYEVDVFLKFRNIYDPVKYTANGTPQGDYAAKGAAGALTLNLTPPSSAARTLQLASNAVILNGVPYGSVPQPPPVVPPTPPALGTPGAWTLVAKGMDIANIAASLQSQITSGANTYSRLAGDCVEDLFFICHFAVA